MLSRTFIVIAVCALASVGSAKPREINVRVRRATCGESDPDECSKYQDRTLCQHNLVGAIVRNLCPIYCDECDSPITITSTTATSTTVTVSTTTATTKRGLCEGEDEAVCSDPNEINSNKELCTQPLVSVLVRSSCPKLCGLCYTTTATATTATATTATATTTTVTATTATTATVTTVKGLCEGEDEAVCSDPNEINSDNALCTQDLVGVLVRSSCPKLCGLCYTTTATATTATATTTTVTATTATATTATTATVTTVKGLCEGEDKAFCSDPNDINSDKALCTQDLVGVLVRSSCPKLCGLCYTTTATATTATATTTTVTATTATTTTASSTTITVGLCKAPDADICTDPNEFNSEIRYCTERLVGVIARAQCPHMCGACFTTTLTTSTITTSTITITTTSATTTTRTSTTSTTTTVTTTTTSKTTTTTTGTTTTGTMTTTSATSTTGVCNGRRDPEVCRTASRKENACDTNYYGKPLWRLCPAHCSRCVATYTSTGTSTATSTESSTGSSSVTTTETSSATSSETSSMSSTASTSQSSTASSSITTTATSSETSTETSSATSSRTSTKTSSASSTVTSTGSSTATSTGTSTGTSSRTTTATSSITTTDTTSATTTGSSTVTTLPPCNGKEDREICKVLTFGNDACNTRYFGEEVHFLCPASCYACIPTFTSTHTSTATSSVSSTATTSHTSTATSSGTSTATTSITSTDTSSQTSTRTSTETSSATSSRTSTGTTSLTSTGTSSMTTTATTTTIGCTGNPDPPDCADARVSQCGQIVEFRSVAFNITELCKGLCGSCKTTTLTSTATTSGTSTGTSSATSTGTTTATTTQTTARWCNGVQEDAIACDVFATKCNKTIGGVVVNKVCPAMCNACESTPAPTETWTVTSSQTSTGTTSLTSTGTTTLTSTGTSSMTTAATTTTVPRIPNIDCTLINGKFFLQVPSGGAVACAEHAAATSGLLSSKDCDQSVNVKCFENGADGHLLQIVPTQTNDTDACANAATKLGSLATVDDVACDDTEGFPFVTAKKECDRLSRRLGDLINRYLTNPGGNHTENCLTTSQTSTATTTATTSGTSTVTTALRCNFKDDPSECADFADQCERLPFKVGSKTIDILANCPATCGKCPEVCNGVSDPSSCTRLKSLCGLVHDGQEVDKQCPGLCETCVRPKVAVFECLTDMQLGFETNASKTAHSFVAVDSNAMLSCKGHAKALSNLFQSEPCFGDLGKEMYECASLKVVDGTEDGGRKVSLPRLAKASLTDLAAKMFSGASNTSVEIWQTVVRVPTQTCGETVAALNKLVTAYREDPDQNFNLTGCETTQTSTATSTKSTSATSTGSTTPSTTPTTKERCNNRYDDEACSDLTESECGKKRLGLKIDNLCPIMCNSCEATVTSTATTSASSTLTTTRSSSLTSTPSSSVSTTQSSSLTSTASTSPTSTASSTLTTTASSSETTTATTSATTTNTKELCNGVPDPDDCRLGSLLPCSLVLTLGSKRVPVAVKCPARCNTCPTSTATSTGTSTHTSTFTTSASSTETTSISSSATTTETSTATTRIPTHPKQMFFGCERVAVRTGNVSLLTVTTGDTKDARQECFDNMDFLSQKLQSKCPKHVKSAELICAANGRLAIDEVSKSCTGVARALRNLAASAASFYARGINWPYGRNMTNSSGSTDGQQQTGGGGNAGGQQQTGGGGNDGGQQQTGGGGYDNGQQQTGGGGYDNGQQQTGGGGGNDDGQQQNDGGGDDDAGTGGNQQEPQTQQGNDDEGSAGQQMQQGNAGGDDVYGQGNTGGDDVYGQGNAGDDDYNGQGNVGGDDYNGQQGNDDGRRVRRNTNYEVFDFENRVSLDAITCVNNKFFMVGNECGKTAHALNIAYQYIKNERNDVGADWEDCNDPTTQTSTATSTVTTAPYESLSCGKIDVSTGGAEALVVHCTGMSPRWLNHMLNDCDEAGIGGIRCVDDVLTAGGAGRTCSTEVKLLNKMLADLMPRASADFAPLKCLPDSSITYRDTSKSDIDLAAACEKGVAHLDKGIKLFKTGEYSNCKFVTVTTTATTSVTSTATSTITTVSTTSTTTTQSTTTPDCYGRVDDEQCGVSLFEADCNDPAKGVLARNNCPLMCNSCTSSTTTTTTLSCNGVPDPPFCNAQFGPEKCNRLELGIDVSKTCLAMCGTCPPTTSSTTVSTTTISSTTTTFDEPGNTYKMDLFFPVPVGTDELGNSTYFAEHLLKALALVPYKLESWKQVTVKNTKSDTLGAAFTTELWFDTSETLEFMLNMMKSRAVLVPVDGMTIKSADTVVSVECYDFDEYQAVVVASPTCQESVAEPLSMIAGACINAPPALECYKVEDGYVLRTKSSEVDVCQNLAGALSASMGLESVNVAFECIAGRYLAVKTPCSSAKVAITTTVEKALTGVLSLNPSCVVEQVDATERRSFYFVITTVIERLVQTVAPPIFDVDLFMVALQGELQRELKVGSSQIEVVSFDTATGMVTVDIKPPTTEPLELLDLLVKSESRPFVFTFSSVAFSTGVETSAAAELTLQSTEMEASASTSTLPVMLVVLLLLVIVVGGLIAARKTRKQAAYAPTAPKIVYNDMVVQGYPQSPGSNVSQPRSPMTPNAGQADPMSPMGSPTIFTRPSMRVNPMQGAAWQEGAVQSLGNTGGAQDAPVAATPVLSAPSSPSPPQDDGQFVAPASPAAKGPADYSVSKNDITFDIAVSVGSLTVAFTQERKETIQEEYNAIDAQSKLFPILTALKPENAKKNRDLGTAAFDYTRVKLVETDGPSDYINANHIDGYFRPNDMIVTQGPTKGTARDFWRMLWESKVSTIAMVTETLEGDKSMSLRYWPDVIGGGLRYGSLTIMLRSTEHVHGNDAIIERIMEVTHSHTGEIRLVSHYQYLGWVEGGIPQSTVDFASFFVSYREKHRESGSTGPILLHGSRGAGRAGTCALFDVALHSALDKGYINLPKVLYLLRRQRGHLVESLAQYNFVYAALVELFYARGDLNTTPAPANMFLYEILGRWELELEEAKRGQAEFDAISLDGSSTSDPVTDDSDDEVGLDDHPSAPPQEATPMKIYTDTVYKPPAPVVPDDLVNGVLARVFSNASIKLQNEGKHAANTVTFDTSNGQRLGMRLDPDPATGYGLHVAAVTPGGQADATGKVSVGQAITHINGTDVRQMAMRDVVPVLQASSTVLMVLVDGNEGDNLYEPVNAVDVKALFNDDDLYGPASDNLYGPGDFPEPEPEPEAILQPISERIEALATAMSTSPKKHAADTDQINAPRARRARASFQVGEDDATTRANDLVAQKAADAEIRKQAAIILEAKRAEKERLAATARDARAAKEKKRTELEEWKKGQAAVAMQNKKTQNTRNAWKSDFAQRAASFQ